MKNLFQPEAVDEVIARIARLQPATERQWGKMNVAQMMAHCSAALDMASGRLNPPRIFIGRVLGPLFKPIYTNEKPFSQNNPTDPQLIVSDQRDFLREQEQLKLKIRQFHDGGEAQCTRHPHPFLATSLRKPGAAECTSIWIITCANLACSARFNLGSYLVAAGAFQS